MVTLNVIHTSQIGKHNPLTSKSISFPGPDQEIQARQAELIRAQC